MTEHQGDEGRAVCVCVCVCVGGGAMTGGRWHSSEGEGEWNDDITRGRWLSKGGGGGGGSR